MNNLNQWSSKFVVVEKEQLKNTLYQALDHLYNREFTQWTEEEYKIYVENIESLLLKTKEK